MELNKMILKHYKKYLEEKGEIYKSIVLVGDFPTDCCIKKQIIK
jgi:hypothetical protein